MSEPVVRVVPMTVYKIEADLLNVTDFSGDPAYLLGRVYVDAQGGPDSHRWFLPHGRRVRIGDVVNVTIIEDPPEVDEGELYEPPADDRRTR